MALPAVTQEYTPGSCRNLRKSMRIPLRREMRPDTLHWVQSNSAFPIKQAGSLNLLEGNLESPPEHHQTSRRTMMSLQECEIAPCRENQLEVTPDSTALAPEQFPLPHHTRQVA